MIYQQFRHKIFYLLSSLLLSQSVYGTPLESYMNKTESEYRWQPTALIKKHWGTIGHYKLISQNWRGHSWKHHLVIVRPTIIRNPDIAFLRVSGDGNGENHIESLKTLAERGGAVVAVLMNVPNQPLYQNRREDALIAYTFNQYLKTGDDSWPLLFPMVKSTIKAMDAIEQIVHTNHNQTIKRFVMSGASKRGWTTWLAAAFDKRIVAIAPLVIDTLNLKAQLQWSEQVYGKQSSKLKDYTELNLHRKMDNQAMQKLRSWIDPYAIIKRYTMPKLILLGTNDPYWTVDSLRHYWDDLPEPKLIYQTPNAGHNLNGGSEALQTIAAFFELIADKKPLPEITWQFNQSKTLNQIKAQVNVNQPAQAINLWSAISKDRDFRDNQWTMQTLNKTADNKHANTLIAAPESGYQAVLMEVELQTESGHNYKLSTQARVMPDSIPQ